MPINYGTNDIYTSGIIETPQLKLSTIPGSGDYIDLYSYARFFHGNNGAYTISEGSFDKFQSVSLADVELVFQLKSATVFGQTIKQSDLIPLFVNVDGGNEPYYRDDGDGLGIANYVDFTNQIFEIFGLKSRMKTMPTKCKINFCKLDKFHFIFEETGDAGISDVNFPKYFSLSTISPWGLIDNISDSYFDQNINGNVGRLWTDTP
jgi:hypothetical protein